MRRTTAFTLVWSVVLLAAGWLVIAHRQSLIDRYQLLNYQPEASIKKLADDDQLTDKGRRLFYVSHPRVEDKDVFVGHCPVSEITIVLGCYSDRRIYVLKVDDTRLSGVEQVTAAHEMLHAAYLRLSGNEKVRINKLVEEAYNKQKNDRLTKTIDAYRRAEPGEEANELHSILATEVTDVGSELEAYYKQYFINRAKVVSFADAYQKVFTDLEAQVDTYDHQLSDLKRVIEDGQASIDAQQKSIQAERNRLNSLLAKGDNTGYNAGVNSFNASINAYNQAATTLSAEIDNYNRIVAERNKLATAQRDLSHSLEATYKPLSE